MPIPKAAGIAQGFPYRYSNDGTYGQLVDDGLTQWHPAFLQLGDTLEACAARYRGFCQHSITQHKPGGRRSRWGYQWVPQMSRCRGADTASAQLLLWDARCQVELEDTPPAVVLQVANRFTQANCMSQAAALHEPRLSCASPDHTPIPAPPAPPSPAVPSLPSTSTEGAGGTGGGRGGPAT